MWAEQAQIKIKQQRGEEEADYKKREIKGRDGEMTEELEGRSD